GEVELSGELARVAQSGALQAPAEGDPDRERAHCHDLRSSGASAYAPANAARMNSQLPALSSAPPVRARPLVHPRASTAPTPITAPPARESNIRDPRTNCSRPAASAERNPPTTTPPISSSSQPDVCSIGESTSLAARVVKAPDAPRPRPLMTNDAKRTSPS